MGISRQFTVGAQFPGEEVDADELDRALLEIGAIIRRLGGGVAIQTVRLAPDPTSSEMVTERVLIKWLSRTDTGEVPETPAPVIATGDEPEPVEEPEPATA